MTAIVPQSTPGITQTGGGTTPAPVVPTAPTPAPTTPTTPTTTTPTAPTTTPVPKATGDKYLDQNLAQQQGLQNENSQAYLQMNNTIQSIMTGTLQMNPEQQSYLNSMQSSLQSSEQIVKQAADASTAVTREALARSGATQASPQTAASQIALSIQAGANQIHEISANANMQIAQFEMNIRSGQISAAQDNYKMFEQYQKDQADTLQKIYTDVATHEQDMRMYGLEVAKYNLSQADFVGKYGITPSQALNGGFGDMQAPVQTAQVSLGQGIGSVKYLDTGSASFKALPPGEQRILSQNAKAQGINVIDSATDQGKTFTSATNALAGIQQGVANGSINPNEPIFKAEGLARKTLLGIPILHGAKPGDDINKALGLNQNINVSPNASVGDVITALQTQMATASGMTLPEFIQGQKVGAANAFVQANTGGASAPTIDNAAAAWGSE